MLNHTLAIALLLASSAVAQDAKQPPPPSDPDAQIEWLLAEHEASELGYMQAYDAFRPRFEMFRRRNFGTEAEARATLWLIQNAWWLRESGHMESTAYPLASDLLERHAGSPQLELLIEYHYVFTRDQKTAIYEALIERSPHRHVQAAAHFGLARLEPARDRSTGEPNEHFAALVNDYATEPWRATTFGAIADAYLNPHPPEALAVGKAAPEIEGVNHEGKPMKLSDYRGKVVLLDFWGDW